jgi:hypothetical protein
MATTTLRYAGIVLLGSLVAAGCGARAVRIAELKDRPYRYEDKTVSVTGVVTRSWSFVPVPVQLYTIDDGTGEITVLSRTGRTVPRSGLRVQVKGRVSELAVLGGRPIGVHMQEQDRKIRR